MNILAPKLKNPDALQPLVFETIHISDNTTPPAKQKTNQKAINPLVTSLTSFYAVLAGKLNFLLLRILQNMETLYCVLV